MTALCAIILCLDAGRSWPKNRAGSLLQQRDELEMEAKRNMHMKCDSRDTGPDASRVAGAISVIVRSFRYS